MLKIGDKIKYFYRPDASTDGYLISRISSARNTKWRVLCVNSDNNPIGIRSFYTITRDIEIDVGMYASFPDSVDMPEFKIKKLDDGEEFFEMYYHIGDRIISRNCLGRYDGQPLIINGYAYSDTTGNLYYIVSIENAPEEARGEYYVQSDLAEWISDDYVVPVVPEYRVCNRCGCEFAYTGGELMCHNCAAREYITPYHRYAPPIQFFSLDNKRAKKYFGVELEVELGGEYDSNAAEVVRAMRRDNGDLFAYCSHDSSLQNGFEIITQPATLGYHQSIEEEYEKVFKMLVSKGYRGHNCPNAGIHVHFSRSYFGDGEDEEYNVTKLLLLVEKFWEEIKIFSRRDYEKSKSYMNKITDSYSNVESFVDAQNKSGQHSGHYFAVNISNPDTIELRMFRSTLNVNTFMCILEFCSSLVEAAKNRTTDEIFAMKFGDLLNTRTREYYNSRVKDTKFDEV